MAVTHSQSDEVLRAILRHGRKAVLKVTQCDICLLQYLIIRANTDAKFFSKSRNMSDLLDSHSSYMKFVLLSPAFRWRWMDTLRLRCIK